MSYVDLDTLQRPVNEQTLDPTWGDQVNDNFTAIYNMIQALQSSSTAAMPVGTVLSYAGALTAPNAGWLVCNGSAVSRTTYASLFAVIGTQFGAGDGSTTFNLPDARSAAVIGASNAAPTGLTARALGASGGEETHTLVTAEMPVHSHGVNDPGHNHGTNNATHNHGITDPGHTHGNTGTESAAHTHHQAAGDVVSLPGSSLNIVTTTATGVTIDSSAAYQTGPEVQNHSHAVPSATTRITATNNGATNLVINSATTGISTQTQGSGTGHNNMQPYLALTYIIKCS